MVILCISEREDKCHLDVPVLITTDQISNPILGFNAIKYIGQTTDDKLLIKLFQTSFDQTDVNRIQAFVSLLQKPDSIEATVKVEGQNTVVPADCIVEVPSKANIGNVLANTTNDFPTTGDQTCRRIGLYRQYYYDEKGVNNYFKVSVLNSSEHDIILKKNMSREATKDIIKN